MHLFAHHAVERGHHAKHICSDGPLKARAVRGHQRVVIQCGVALINASVCSAIADEVLGGGRQPATLDALDQLIRVLTDQFGVVAVALVTASPAKILRLRHRRSKYPVDTGRSNSGRRRLTDCANEFRVARCTQPNVMGIQGGAAHIVVSVYGVCPPNDGNAGPTCGGIEGGVAQLGRIISPLVDGGRAMTVWIGAAAIQDAAYAEATNLFKADVRDFGLNQLSRFLCQRQLLENLLGTASQHPCVGAWHHRDNTLDSGAIPGAVACAVVNGVVPRRFTDIALDDHFQPTYRVPSGTSRAKSEGVSSA